MTPSLSLNIEDQKSFQTQKAPKLQVPAVFSHHVLQIELEEAESQDLMSCLGQVSLAQNAQVSSSCCSTSAQGRVWRTEHALSGRPAAVGKAHSWVLVVILFLLRICRRIHLLWGPASVISMKLNFHGKKVHLLFHKL